ncbi:39S ribosomal protein L39, mitochondrial isoform X2 [Sardina pilchardus]|uniref:39S ribosomal protein L39, mitochondrial isoform X2 n=1 Tax=Sardina pilchardus TaxID=27697 RepID=UPI002E106DE5
MGRRGLFTSLSHTPAPSHCSPSKTPTRCSPTRYHTLTHSCALTLLTFKDANPLLANQAYWRSCATLLGQVLQNAFKDDFPVELLKIPEVPVTSGAFCCDVVLDPQLDSWTPTEEALQSFTRAAQQLIHRDLLWEPLEVAPPVALEIFAHSRCKQSEVEELAALNPSGTVGIYRCGDHVTLSGGPLVSRTGLCMQYEVTALHSLGQGAWGLHRRAQGLSLPRQLPTHHTVWGKLRRRATKLVEVTPTSANQTAALLPSESSPPQDPAPPAPQ